MRHRLRESSKSINCRKQLVVWDVKTYLKRFENVSTKKAKCKWGQNIPARCKQLLTINVFIQTKKKGIKNTNLYVLAHTYAKTVRKPAASALFHTHRLWMINSRDMHVRDGVSNLHNLLK